MPARNRVNPFSEIVSIPGRGLLMGNRGCLHVDGQIRHRYNGRRWIICTTEYRGRRLDQWAEGRYTVLFFHDEAVALAAGHRPCARCMPDRFRAFVEGWRTAFGEKASANDIDAQLHRERVVGEAQRTTRAPWGSLPSGAFAVVDGVPVLVLDEFISRWTNDGYLRPTPRPASGVTTLLTPPSTLEVLRAGYSPIVAPISPS